MAIRNFLRALLNTPPDYVAAQKLAEQRWFQKAVLSVVGLQHKILDQIAPDEEIEAITRKKQQLLEDKEKRP